MEQKLLLGNKNIILDWKNTKSEDKVLNKELKKNIFSLNDFFTDTLKFGTAGVRAQMGAGYNKINIFTISALAKAFAIYLKSINKSITNKKFGIIIAHDTRVNSKLYARRAAEVLADNGISAYLFKENKRKPTPLVSYAIKKMKFAAGISITASHNPCQYNGFKIYNSLGTQFSEEETQEITNILKEINPLEVNYRKNSVKYLNSFVEEDYVADTIKHISLFPNEMKRIRVTFSPLCGASDEIAKKFLDKLRVKYHIVQTAKKNGQSKIKIPNPEYRKSFKVAIANALKNSSDLVFVTDQDGDRLGVAVKYKKRYQFINGNQIAALYLDFLVNYYKKKKMSLKNSYIVKTIISGNLAARIAKKNQIKVYETHVGFKNIAKLIKEKQGENFLLAYEESNGTLINPELTGDKDAMQMLVAFIEMVNHYSYKGINIYERLLHLFKIYRPHKNFTTIKYSYESGTNKLLKKVKKIKRIGEFRVRKIEDYQKGLNGLTPKPVVKVFLSNGTWFAIRPSGTERGLKIYSEIVGDKSESFSSAIIFEETIQNIIEENAETINNNVFSSKRIFRYIIFSIIIALSLVFVFLKVYKTLPNKSVFEKSIDIFSSQKRIIWFSIFLFGFFKIFISALMRKRLMAYLGKSVKIKHLIISSSMGIFIAFITPFAIGGDFIAYWYLRKKGVKRSTLLSSFITTTIIFQLGVILQTLILVPTGYPIYKMIFNSNDYESKVAFILFLSGLSWSVFSSIFIFSLAIFERVQKFIIKKVVGFLNHFNLIFISDPDRIKAKYLYELKLIRMGLKKIWQKKLFVFELLIYEILPKIVIGFAVILSFTNFVKPNLPLGTYWSQVIAWDIIRTANALSVFPGGSGTAEWLSININQVIYNGGRVTASSLDVLWKIIFNWPFVLGSLLTIITVILVEKRKQKATAIVKDAKSRGIDIKKPTTSFYAKLSVIWVFIALIIILVFFLYKR